MDEIFNGSGRRSARLSPLWLKGLLFTLLLPRSGLGVAREVVVGASVSIQPPYIDKHNDTGLALDVIRAALAVDGHSVRMKYLAGNGLDNHFKMGQVDAMLMNGNYDTVTAIGVPSHRSAGVYRLRDYAITLEGFSAPLRQIEDLGEHRVVAFFPASKVLGARYAQAVSQSPHYKEIPVQTSQLLALYRGLADVAIGDRLIVEYLQQEVRKSTGEYHPLAYHFEFPPAVQHLFFLDRALRDSFDRGLNQLKASGRYARILTTYAIGN